MRERVTSSFTLFFRRTSVTQWKNKNTKPKGLNKTLWINPTDILHYDQEIYAATASQGRSFFVNRHAGAGSLY
jgi:hypothetical protein